MHPPFGFQDPATSTMFKTVALHDHAIAVVTLVITFVGILILALTINRLSSRNTYEAQTLEIL